MKTFQPSLFDELELGILNAHALIPGGIEAPEVAFCPDRFGTALREFFSTQHLPPIRTLSLFSGGGGLDIGFHDANFEIVEMVEIEERYAASLRANTQPGHRLEGARVSCVDIREFDGAGLEVDFLIGGPPCQTFSAAGRRASGVRGTTDARGTLFQEYVRLLETLRPRAFLFENVYGITGAEGGAPWREIQSAFRAAGYQISSRVLDAADYGVPQHRERLFIVGVRDAEAPFVFPRPTHGPILPRKRHFITRNKPLKMFLRPHFKKTRLLADVTAT